MTTLKGGSQVFDLTPGEVLTIAAVGDGSLAYVSLESSVGSPPTVSSTPVAGGSSTSVGPFTVQCAIKVYAVGRVTIARGDGSPVSGARMSTSAAVVWIGQSLELGATLEPDSKGVMRRAYLSAPSQNYYEPDPNAKGGSGSYITPILQKLGAVDKMRVLAANCAVGGTSLVKDWVGVQEIAGWQANRAYRGARTTLGNGDPGTLGEVILENGRLWECTTGCTHLAFYDSSTPLTVGGTAWRTNLSVIAKNTDRTSANAKPTFSGTAIVGDTVTDNGTGSTGGGLVWTCRAVSSPAADADGLRVCRLTDVGFDPYFALARAANAVLSLTASTDRRFCFVSNATGDAQLRNPAGTRISAANVEILYARAHSFICQYMINPARGIRTIHWGSLFYPAFATADFDALEKALYGADLNSPPNHAASLLYTYLVTNSGYPLGVPGGTIGNYYVIPSLYRLLGTNVTGLLQSPQPNPHPTLVGNQALADALYPYLRQVLLDVAS